MQDKDLDVTIIVGCGCTGRIKDIRKLPVKGVCCIYRFHNNVNGKNYVGGVIVLEKGNT